MKTNGLVTKLKNLFAKGRGVGELVQLMKMSEEDPTDMRIKLKIGEIYFKKKQVDQGIAIFKEVGEHYIKEGFSLKAVAIYKNILKFSPGSVQFNENLAELFTKLSMPEDAMTQYRIVINYYQTHQMKDDAVRVSRALVQLNPENIDNRLKLAELLNIYGKSEEAFAEYQLLAKDLRKDMKRLDLLVDIYEKIILKKPDEKGLLRELCIFYLKLRDPKKVLRKIERMKLKDDPEFAPIYEKALSLEQTLAKNLENPESTHE